MNSSLAIRLRAVRTKAGLSQVKLAKISGTQQSVINCYESGKRGAKRPNAFLIDRIATALKVDSSWLIGKEEK